MQGARAEIEDDILSRGGDGWDIVSTPEKFLANYAKEPGEGNG